MKFCRGRQILSRLADFLNQRRLRPDWRNMSIKDLIEAVKLEVAKRPDPPLVDWEALLLGWLRDGDHGLVEIDPSNWPVKATKCAIAKALVEGVRVPPTLLTWLGNEMLHPTKVKRGAKPKSLRDHEILRTAQMVVENTNLPIDDAEHIGHTALFVVAEVFGMEQTRVKDVYYRTRTAYNLHD